MDRGCDRQLAEAEFGCDRCVRMAQNVRGDAGQARELADTRQYLRQADEVAFAAVGRKYPVATGVCPGL